MRAQSPEAAPAPDARPSRVTVGLAPAHDPGAACPVLFRRLSCFWDHPVGSDGGSVAGREQHVGCTRAARGRWPLSRARRRPAPSRSTQCGPAPSARGRRDRPGTTGGPFNCVRLVGCWSLPSATAPDHHCHQGNLSQQPERAPQVERSRKTRSKSSATPSTHFSSASNGLLRRSGGSPRTPRTNCERRLPPCERRSMSPWPSLARCLRKPQSSLTVCGESSTTSTTCSPACLLLHKPNERRPPTRPPSRSTSSPAPLSSSGPGRSRTWDCALTKNAAPMRACSAARLCFHGWWTTWWRMRSSTTSGGVGYRCKPPSDGPVVRVVVENGGAVLQPEDVSQLARPFKRLGAERTGSERGNGLGLSIVQAIAEAHDGVLDLQARSAEGSGLS